VKERGERDGFFFIKIIGWESMVRTLAAVTLYSFPSLYLGKIS
jgi:hypothetical protein